MVERSPQNELSQIIGAYQQSQAVYVAAKLGLADLLKEGPRTPEELAESTGTHARSLYRLLRALASIGLFAEDEQGRFTLTPMAELLRSDHPDSKRAMALMMGEEHYRAWGDLLYSVQTGRTAFERVYGMPVFEFLSQNPEKGEIFDQAMTAIHGAETEPMVEAYDFSGVGTLADIGGGNGSVLSAVLRRHPDMQGILFDLPPVVDRARGTIEAAGLADRCRFVSGNFFEEVPSGADAYLLRHIIHDWDDAKCTTILQTIHRAIPDEGRLLVLESVIPPGNDPLGAKFLDLTMLALPGGQERTEAEFRQLFETAGFRLTRIIPTATEVSIIEGRKA